MGRFIGIILFFAGHALALILLIFSPIPNMAYSSFGEGLIGLFTDSWVTCAMMICYIIGIPLMLFGGE